MRMNHFYYFFSLLDSNYRVVCCLWFLILRCHFNPRCNTINFSRVTLAMNLSPGGFSKCSVLSLWLPRGMEEKKARQRTLWWEECSSKWSLAAAIHGAPYVPHLGWRWVRPRGAHMLGLGGRQKFYTAHLVHRLCHFLDVGIVQIGKKKRKNKRKSGRNIQAL